MKTLEMAGDNKAWARHKMDLIGPDRVLGTTLEWIELDLMADRNISPSEWKGLPLEERATMIAHRRLSSMFQLINRHEEMLARNKEGNANKD